MVRYPLPTAMLALALLGACKAQPNDPPAPQPEPPAPEAEAEAQNPNYPDDNCPADASWITAPSFPDPDAFDSESNCGFHRYAYQTFFKLVSPYNGGGADDLVFEHFAVPSQLFIPSGPATTYADRPQSGALLMPRLAKGDTASDISVFQAGPGNKALIDQAANITYFGNHLNETYWDFVVEQKLFDLSTLQNVDPKMVFPNGSLELKSAWRLASTDDGTVYLADAESRYFTIKASVPSVSMNDMGQIVEDPSKPINGTLALVSLHVTGVVQEHPEFIWATFEHQDNAPLCDNLTAQSPSGHDWNFYNGTAPRDALNQFDISNPLAVVNTCLETAYGGGSDANQSAIRTLNANVQAVIKPEMDARLPNYSLVGGVWATGAQNGDYITQIPLNNGAYPPDSNGPRQAGSLDLANVTLETFTQDQNCFACHNGGKHEVAIGDQSTTIGAKNLNLSHFIVNYQAGQQLGLN